MLIVEDEEPLGQALSDKFSHSGRHHPRWAKTADEARTILREEKVDLILLDIVLPGMDGDELLRELKADDSEYRMIPVVMLTNLGEIDEIYECMDRGALDYLIKSAEHLADLLDKVENKWLG